MDTLGAVMAHSVRPHGITVTELLNVVAGTGLRRASRNDGHPLPLTSSTFFDPWTPPRGRRSGILLGIGLHPEAPTTATVIRDAARSGFGAVVIKSMSLKIDPLVAIADAEGIALLIADDDIEWRLLDALLDSALTTASERNNALPGFAVGDLFALANAIAAMVGGATTIENLQEHVLAFSTLPGQVIDQERRESILGRQVPKRPDNPEQYSSVFQASGTVRVSSEPPALSRLAVAVRAGTQLLGSIWVVDASGSLDSEAERALERAADIAALHMLRVRSANDLARQQRSELLRRILEGSDDSHLAAEQLGLDLLGPFVVVAFQPDLTLTVDEMQISRLVDLVSINCEAHRHGTQCTVIGNTIYALFSGMTEIEQREATRVATRLVSRAGTALHIAVRASVGSAVNTISRISKSRHDADLVLMLQAKQGSFRRVASAHEVQSQLTLLELAQDFRDTTRSLSPVAKRVLEWDARTGTEYAKTLRTYLNNSRDSAATAAILSLHQNTLRYRLRRAQELLGVDLANADDTLILWLALRVAELD